MKRLGVIGGLGVGTTAEFYLEIAKGFQNKKADCSPPVVIGSVSAPLSVYDDCILKNECRFLPYLIKEAKRLERAKVDYLVMPCNTLHRYIDEIRHAVKVPVISIVDETVEHIKNKGHKKVGLLSTMATVQNKVYEAGLIANGIDYLTVNSLQQAKLNQMIVNLVNGECLDSDRAMLENIIGNLENQGAEVIILACTDLQLLKPQSESIEIIDTMKVLANSSVDRMLDKSNIESNSNS